MKQPRKMIGNQTPQKDANRQRKAKITVEILLVIAAILIIPLFFAIRSGAKSPAVQRTSTSAPQPTPASTTAAQTNAKEPPACTFPLAQVTPTETAPENYTFSEPKVVLIAPKGNVYSIAQWLPDNQWVLMTEELRNVEIGNSNPLQESINLYNPETGESKVYAIHAITNEAPSWLAALNAVVYPTLNYTSLDRKNHTSTFTRQVWVSYGDPGSAQLLADNLPESSIAVNSGGSEMAYSSDKEISKLDKSLRKLPSVPFEASQWDYAKGRRNKNPVSFNMAWQPGTSLIFLYSDGDMGGGGYTFIVNADTGQVCELNFGGWALGARWSSDGRYLAIIRIAKPYTSDLAVLDIMSGNLTTLNVPPQEIVGQHEVEDFVWAPDNRHLLAIGSVLTSQNSQGKSDLHALYLVDLVSGQSVRVVPKYTSFVYSGIDNLAWSPDGSKLLVLCPTNAGNRICLVYVHITGQ